MNVVTEQLSLDKVLKQKVRFTFLLKRVLYHQEMYSGVMGWLWTRIMYEYLLERTNIFFFSSKFQLCQ